MNTRAATYAQAGLLWNVVSIALVLAFVAAIAIRTFV